MTKTIVYKNPNRDTRTAPKDVTYGQFQRANNMHIIDVSSVMKRLGEVIERRGMVHDCTKKSSEPEFYRDFISTINEGTNFVEGEWYQHHINKERHHLLSRCPEDVNLIDVLEMIVDCTCAGLARSGEVRDLEINSDILEKAVKNTVKMIADSIEVRDMED